MNSLSSGLSMTEVSKSYREERDLKQIFEKKLKSDYRHELEKQMESNRRKREQEDLNKKKQEISILKTYPPFGRRSEFYMSVPTHHSEFDASSQSGSEKAFSIADVERRRESNLSNLQTNRNKAASLSGEEFSKRSIKDNHSDKFNTPYNEFMDNDPNKDIKSVFGATTGQEPFYPWGKPGNGAPRVDPNTGSRSTRIAGNLWYHVNGQTPNDRKERLEHYNQLSSARSKIPIESAHLHTLNSKSLLLNADDWIIRKKEEYMNRMSQNSPINSRVPSATKHNSSQKAYESSRANGQWFDSTFGRPGHGAPTVDARRRNLNEVLESPRLYGAAVNNNYGMPEILYPKSNPSITSNHHNGFDFIPSNKRF